MLPNHAPLVIAEQFGTLAALSSRPHRPRPRPRAGHRHADRPRAAPQPGGRRRQFPAGRGRADRLLRAGRPGQRVRAVPGEGQEVEVWILGSSTYGAQLAAMLGLPYAFASHFAPAEMEHARRHLPLALPAVGAARQAACDARPQRLRRRHDAEAQLLFSSLQQAFVNLRSGRPGKLPPPVEDYEETLDPMARAMLDQALSCAVVGSPATVRQGASTPSSGEPAQTNSW